MVFPFPDVVHTPWLLPRVIGDMCLLSSYLIVPFMIHFAGPRAVSFQTQALTLFACLLRYGDVLGNWHQGSLYLFLFKVIFLTLAFINVMSLSAAKWQAGDQWHWPKLAIPTFLLSAILAAPLHYKAGASWSEDFFEFCWAMSHYVGAMACIAQIILTWDRRFRQDEPIRMHRTTALYFTALVAHQSLYVFNWILRFHYERMLDPISICAGSIRLVLTTAFMVLYHKRDKEGQIRLPLQRD